MGERLPTAPFRLSVFLKVLSIVVKVGADVVNEGRLEGKISSTSMVILWSKWGKNTFPLLPASGDTSLVDDWIVKVPLTITAEPGGQLSHQRGTSIWLGQWLPNFEGGGDIRIFF